MLLHLFNPGYEEYVLPGTDNHTPSANVRRMRRELALLPCWYGALEDRVWIEEEQDIAYISRLSHQLEGLAQPLTRNELPHRRGTRMVAAPWGLSREAIRTFTRLAKSGLPELELPRWKEEYVALTGRQTAAHCLDKLRHILPNFTPTTSPCFCGEIEEVERYLQENHPPFVVKAPYSSSGRGLIWLAEKQLNEPLRQRLQRLMRNQGTISIEPGYDKVADFAMEFSLSSEGICSYQGLSLFATGEKGAYQGNRMEPQERMEERLKRQMPSDSRYEEVKEAVGRVLQEQYGSLYSGAIGVDMMLYRDERGAVKLHPCVEINMRMTMGMVAIRLFNSCIAPTSSGYYSVEYAANAYEQHLRMQEKQPLVIEGRRIKSGYLSLCPVKEETAYRAYILVEESGE